MHEESKIAKGKVKAAYCKSRTYNRSLFIDDSNHSEVMRLKITENRVMKSRISVNNSVSSRVMQNVQVTKNNVLKLRFTENKIS